MPEIGAFHGIHLGLPTVASLVEASLDLADQLQTKTGGGTLQVAVGVSRLALLAAVGASNAMLTFASATCTLGVPPEDIGAVTDRDGNLILRCGHSPPHEWDYRSGAQR
jgi:hypothetical protein